MIPTISGKALNPHDGENTASMVVQTGASVALDDMVLLFAVNGYEEEITVTDATFALITYDLTSGASSATTLRYRRAVEGDVEKSSYTISAVGAARIMDATLFVIQGVDWDNGPFGGTTPDVISTDDAVSTHTCPTITTDVDDCLVIFWQGHSHRGTATAYPTSSDAIHRDTSETSGIGVSPYLQCGAGVATIEQDTAGTINSGLDFTYTATRYTNSYSVSVRGSSPAAVAATLSAPTATTNTTSELTVTVKTTNQVDGKVWCATRDDEAWSAGDEVIITDADDTEVATFRDWKLATDASDNGDGTGTLTFTNSAPVPGAENHIGFTQEIE